jgi:hypothetical protein
VGSSLSLPAQQCADDAPATRLAFWAAPVHLAGLTATFVGAISGFPITASKPSPHCTRLSAVRTTGSASRLSEEAASVARELRWSRWQSWTACPRIRLSYGFAVVTTHALLRHPGNDAGSEKSADTESSVR